MGKKNDIVWRKYIAIDEDEYGIIHLWIEKGGKDNLPAAINLVFIIIPAGNKM